MINEYTKELSSINAKNNIPKELIEMQTEYRKNGVPTILTDGLNELLLMVSIKNPKTVLELGTATGCSGIAILKTLPNAKLTTVEKNHDIRLEAIENFKKFGVYDRVTSIVGDSYETALTITGEFDFIFLDCNKASYTRLLPVLKNLLKKGGVLFTDNVLFRGYVAGEKVPPKYYNSLTRKIREFDEILAADTDLITCFFDVGDGIAISIKK